MRNSRRTSRPKSWSIQRTKKLPVGRVRARAQVTPRGRKKIKVSVDYQV